MSNNLANVIPVLVAEGLKTLRSACVMPRQVNTDYKNDPANQGDTVNVWIPSSLTVSDVAPSAAPVQGQDSAPVRMPIPLSQWRHAGFYLTDKEMEEIVGGVRSGQTGQAIKSLAEDINSYILSQYSAVYGFTGTPGTTPFASDVTAATSARKVLNKQLAPAADRRMVLGVDAEANALALPQLTTFLNTGSTEAIIQGTMGRKLGFDWLMDQQIPSHTAAAQAGTTTANGAQAVGAGSTDGGRTGTISMAQATAASALNKGDIFTIAGDSQTYVVLAAATLAVGNTTVSIAPALQHATAGGEAITVKGSHVVNLAFHRDAFAFVSRPLQKSSANTLEIVSVPDEISGVTFRLEVIRQNKQVYFDFDALYGAACVRPELACRVAG